MGQLHPVGRRVAPEVVEQRRGTEHVGAAMLRQRMDQFFRLRVPWKSKVHVREDGRHTESGVEEREERERREVDLAGLDPIRRPNALDLRVEHSMGVNGTLGHSGRPGREEDGRDILGRRCGRDVSSAT
jgi:hypothetical protein